MLQKRRYVALSLDSSQLFDLSKLLSWLRSRVAGRVTLLASSAELLGLTTSSILPFEDHWTFTVNVLCLALSVRVFLEHYWSFSDFFATLLWTAQSLWLRTHIHTPTHTHKHIHTHTHTHTHTDQNALLAYGHKTHAYPTHTLTSHLARRTLLLTHSQAHTLLP